MKDFLLYILLSIHVLGCSDSSDSSDSRDSRDSNDSSDENSEIVTVHKGNYYLKLPKFSNPNMTIKIISNDEDESSQRSVNKKIIKTIKKLDMRSIFNDIDNETKVLLTETCLFAMTGEEDINCLVAFLAYVKFSAGDDVCSLKATLDDSRENKYAGRGIIKASGIDNYKKIDICVKNEMKNYGKFVSFVDHPKLMDKKTKAAFFSSACLFMDLINRGKQEINLDKTIKALKPMGKSYASFKETEQYESLKEFYTNINSYVTEIFEQV